MPTGIANLGEIGHELVEALVLGHFLQHLAIADHGIERRAQLVTHIGKEGRFVLTRRFELRVQLPELLAGTVDIGGECAKLVPVGNVHPAGELAGRDLPEPRVHPLHGPDERPGDRVAERERQDDRADREPDHLPPRPRVRPLGSVDARHHVRLGLVHELVGQALEPVRERTGLGHLHLPALGGLARPDQLDHVGHDPDEALVVLADAAEQLDLVLCDELEPIEIVAELVELAQRRLERPLVRNEQRRGDAVELARGVVLELAVGRDLALELD